MKLRSMRTDTKSKIESGPVICLTDKGANRNWVSRLEKAKKKPFYFLTTHCVTSSLWFVNTLFTEIGLEINLGRFCFLLPVSKLSSLFSSRKICLCLFYSWEWFFIAWVGMMSSTSDFFQSNHFWNGCDSRTMFKNVRRRCRDTEPMSSGVI